MKKKTSQLRDDLIDYLLANGWEPNKYSTQWFSQDLDERGLYHYSLTNSNVGFLISKNKDYALTIKDTVVTVHQASRRFCKVLSLSIKDIEYYPEGIASGLLMLRNPQ